jgi:hypothetical protein
VAGPQGLPQERCCLVFCRDAACGGWPVMLTSDGFTGQSRITAPLPGCLATHKGHLEAVFLVLFFNPGHVSQSLASGHCSCLGKAGALPQSQTKEGLFQRHLHSLTSHRSCGLPPTLLPCWEGEESHLSMFGTLIVPWGARGH